MSAEEAVRSASVEVTVIGPGVGVVPRQKLALRLERICCFPDKARITRSNWITANPFSTGICNKTQTDPDQGAYCLNRSVAEVRVAGRRHKLKCL
jgi:hypothetical protein